MKIIAAAIMLLFVFLIPSTLFAAIDKTPPTGSITVNTYDIFSGIKKPTTDNVYVVLLLSAKDTGSGLSQMTFSDNNKTWSSPERFNCMKAWTLTSGDGKKTVYVKFSDKAGNWSNVYSGSIILDTKGPSITITSPTEGEVIR
jgi:hypothetical protein